MIVAPPSLTPSKRRGRPHRRCAALVLASLLAAATGAQAQKATAASAPSAAAQQRLAQARERLQLSPEQENRLRALMQQEGQKLRVIRDKYAGDTSLRARGARSREARAVQEDFRAQLQDLLSPAQLDEWDKMAAEARAQARERRQQQPR